MFPPEMLEDVAVSSDVRVEVNFSNGILVLYSNNQWEWISNNNKKERTLVR